MSINVNVSGNPVLIRNGKKCTVYNKDECERRRLMRFQQVRQQSKTIAEKVRKRVHQKPTTLPPPSTTTQTATDFEQKSEEQLQCWQAKKLLELQNQYQDAIKEIGLGHRQVDSVLNEDDEFNQQQEINERMAGERGRKALDKLLVEKNEQNLKQAIPVQRKRIVRDIENNRADNLCKVQQNRVLKDKKAKTKTVGEREKENQATESKETVSVELQTTPSLLDERGNRDKFVQTIESELDQPDFAKDTRISERIKRRQLPQILDDYPDDHKSDSIDDDMNRVTVEKPTIVCCHHCQCDDERPDKQPQIDDVKKKTDEIPIKPKIKLKPSRSSNQPSSSVRIDRITDDDLITSPILSDRDDIKQTAQQRERDAQLRGKKALERERIKREYRELLQKLPLLQKQERGYQLHDKEKYHMDDERLREYERKRQNRLDNVYERLFPKESKTIITLPKQQDLPQQETDVDQERNVQHELQRLLENLQQQKEVLCKKRKRTISSPPPSSDRDVCRQIKATQTRIVRKKKLKKRVLQNTSTQTTPKIETDIGTSPIIPPQKPQKRSELSCICTKTVQKDDYEIVIKLQQDNQPEVIVNRPTTVEIKQKINSTTGTATTSYLSPPNFSQPSSTKSSDDREKSKRLNAYVNGELDPRLVTYIKKLLDATPRYIETLEASPPSDLSTPSQSTIEMASNHPIRQLRNVMRYFNLSSADIRSALSSSDLSSIYHPQTDDAKKKEKLDLEQYTQIVEDCNKRITNLNSLIDKVRAEKERILVQSTSNSTTMLGETIKHLFEIDPVYLQSTENQQQSERVVEEPPITNEQLLERYQRLMTVPDDNYPPVEAITLNIPKLPKFDLPSSVLKPKPPPSKGLVTSQQKLGTPHELSTIPEFDSTTNPLNERIELIETSDRSEIEEAVEEMLSSIGMQWAIQTLRKTRETRTLATTSTSSSSSTSLKDESIRNSSGSRKTKESLGDFLRKQLLKSSDSLKSTDKSQEAQQLTSTPILGDGTNTKLFVGETELSSVNEEKSDKIG